MKNKPVPAAQTAPFPKPLILLFLLLSGSCGLVYEILWMKMLILVIGNTIFAATTVLTAFMGGLALGSYLAGRFSGRIKNPLRAYGILEGGIGLYALLLPLLIAGTQPLLRFFYQEFGPSLYTFGLLRFLICGILLLVPTTLMGATLPVLSRYFVTGQNHLGRNVGLLYGVNTCGAVLGCALAGFVLIPTLGVTGTIDGATVLNLAIGAGMLILAKKFVRYETPSIDKEKNKSRQKQKKNKGQPGSNQPTSKPRSQEVSVEYQPAVLRAVLAGIGISGLASMVYQIAWTRVIALAIGSSVYAFSLIVTAFICGLGLGSLLAAALIDRIRNLPGWLVSVQVAIALAAVATVPALGRLPLFVAESVTASSSSFIHIHLAEFAVILVIILIPTLMMGAAVPLAVKICTPDARRVARFFGNVYSVNTLGAVVGSFMAGFMLIPWLGTQNSILCAVALNFLAGLIILLHSARFSARQRLAATLVTAGVAVAIWIPLPRWDNAILASGAYLYAEDYRKTSTQKRIDLAAAIQTGKQLLYFKEGLHALVTVEKTQNGDVLLGINGKIDASVRGGDVATQLMLGHLPLLLHQGARDVLVIGLGSGMTLEAVEQHPIRTVDVVEIEAAVVEANQYFREYTGNSLDDERVNLIVGDGRNHLALTDRHYDVIISEPSNPWIAGMANLFSREFFEAAKQRLGRKGIMCQWVHAYSMSPDDFKTIINTFQSVFPNAALWETSFANDYLLIGLPPDWQMPPPPACWWTTWQASR